jgi:hypothetical protein
MDGLDWIDVALVNTVINVRVSQNVAKFLSN